MTTAAPVLVADVGGTHVRVAVVDGTTILARSRERADLASIVAIDSVDAERQVIDTLVAACAPMRELFPQLAAAAIGFPGFFRGDSGVLAASPNLPLLREFPLAARLSDALVMPVAVQNDALMAAIGEARFGAGEGSHSLLHVTLGTGVGGGLLLDGRPYGGETGMAMEFGHLCVAPGGRLCGCGNRGCLEAYASATAVARIYAERSGRKLDAGEIHTAAIQGDQIAVDVLHDAGNALGMAMAMAVNLLDIHLVSVGGGLSGAWSYLLPAIEAGLQEHVITPQRGEVRVVRSLLGDDAPLFGAATLACRLPG